MRCTLPGEVAQWAPPAAEATRTFPHPLKYHDPLWNYEGSRRKSGVKRLPSDMPNGEDPATSECFTRCPWGQALYAPLVQACLEAYHANKSLGTPIPDDPQIAQGVAIIANEHDRCDLEEAYADKSNRTSPAGLPLASNR